jgi:hypothetical protein
MLLPHFSLADGLLSGQAGRRRDKDVLGPMEVPLDWMDSSSGWKRTESTFEADVRGTSFRPARTACNSRRLVNAKATSRLRRGTAATTCSTTATASSKSHDLARGERVRPHQ